MVTEEGMRREGGASGGLVREALKRGPQPLLAPRAGSSASPEGMGSCCALKGLQERHQRGTGLGGGEGLGRGKERSGKTGAQASWSSILGAPRRTRLSWGMGQGERRLLGGTRGKGPRCSRQRWVCAGGEPGKDGGLRDRSGSQGKVGDDERGSLGKQ